MKAERNLSAASQLVCAICFLGAAANAQLGEVDPGFAPAINGSVASVAAQADGKLVIGGTFTTVNGVQRPYLARLNANGSLDSTFNLTAGPGQFINHVEIAQAKLFVSGGDGIRRFSDDGTLDWLYPMQPSTFAVDAEQRVVFGGRFTRVENQYHRNLARLTSNGSLDATFAPAIGCCAEDGVDSILATGNQILVGGVFRSVNGSSPAGNLARIGNDGSVDAAFVGTAEPRVLAIAATADGRFYRVSEQVLTRHLSNGSLDPDFAPQSPSGFDERFLTVTVHRDGVLVGGNFTLSSGGSYLARFTGNGSPDASFAIRPNGTVRDIAIQADGSVVIVGDFTEVDGQQRSGVARIGQTAGATAPSLATVLTAAGLVVSWPASAANGRLEFRELAGNTWSPVGLTPVTANGRCCVTNPVSGAGRIYRLVRP